MPTIAESRKRAKADKLQAHRQEDGSYIVYNVVKGTSYSVMRVGKGSYCCTCPYMTKGSHLGNNTGTCKHIQRVIDKVAPCGSCGVEHDDTFKAGKCSQCRYYDKMGL